VADGALQQIPFAALTPAPTHYLVQDVELAWAASIGDYVGALANAKAQTTSSIDIWVLCDPIKGLEGAAAPPESRAEGLDVARRYRVSRTSCGAAATGEAFMEALANARVVHFAGHAALDPVDPWSSKLVVSPTERHPLGVLLLRDIQSEPESRQPPAAQVVVLAACSTAVSGFDGRRDGVSFASSLQRMGVPWVVATEWDIEDASARELFTRFHTGLAGGRLDPASALRAAQLELLERGNGPLAWAGVVALASGRSAN
jgi:CHAT domain-containing protein